MLLVDYHIWLGLVGDWNLKEHFQPIQVIVSTNLCIGERPKGVLHEIYIADGSQVPLNIIIHNPQGHSLA